ncbi:hypothetical protein ASG12_17830 [Williamsia sp. Leaf354]|jgi:hypothetical protein|uniref:hypothetical protein n=1 Tax=Williamsia sp. Leaf354 TaxID=1736349 RepID=UPI0006FCEE09|nr:hypothetical protein [Williamsia sp. Leaf354]KQR96086.1 hypothetical protein ASG12_17830 [Williamsia sp. Leaf354]
MEHDLDEARGVAASDLIGTVRRIAESAPTRVVCRYNYRSLNYRELDAAIELMVPVTRSQQMDDRAAVVAAVFAGMPALSTERDPATVASVVDGTFARIMQDLAELEIAAAATPVRTMRTSEIDLRGIASRLAGA